LAFIELIDEQEATGPLARLYAQARARAGKVYSILKMHSRDPATLRTSMALYQTTTKAPGALSNHDRELIAVVVSRTNDCFY
jgi:alkylhydroperoxidase family enzyme